MLAGSQGLTTEGDGESQEGGEARSERSYLSPGPFREGGGPKILTDLASITLVKIEQNWNQDLASWLGAAFSTFIHSASIL